MPEDLPHLRRRHQALAARLGQVGFALPGSLTRRYTYCGKPGCRCQASPPRDTRFGSSKDAEILSGSCDNRI